LGEDGLHRLSGGFQVNLCLCVRRDFLQQRLAQVYTME
jgi:hypothetical protein